MKIKEAPEHREDQALLCPLQGKRSDHHGLQDSCLWELQKTDGTSVAVGKEQEQEQSHSDRVRLDMGLNYHWGKD